MLVSFSFQRASCQAGVDRYSLRGVTLVKTATFEALLESVVEDGDGWLFTLEGKTYRIADKDEVRGIAESHGYILIY
jgi:hypothetical protein